MWIRYYSKIPEFHGLRFAISHFFCLLDSVRPSNRITFSASKSDQNHGIPGTSKPMANNVPSGKRLHNYGKSASLIGKPTIHRQF